MATPAKPTIKTGPIKTGPIKTGPIKTGPIKTGLSKAISNKAGLSKASPIKAGTNKAQRVASGASTKSKIAAAAKAVAARRAAVAKSAATAKAAAERPAKSVAAVAQTGAKRSSPPVTMKPVQPKFEVTKGASLGFELNEYVVYPAHGVGQIIAIEEQEIAGITLELFVITFEKDKMTLRVPTAKFDAMRKLSDRAVVEKALTTLKGRARVKRTMWSRRAQEYENKINSGDLIAIAEVVRDLYRSENQPEQSYSERQLYEAALDRMARELAAVEVLDERYAIQRITDVLSKSAKGRRQAEEAAASENGSDVEAA